MAAKAVTFTEERVRRFACPGGKHYELHWDKRQSGLGVRVTANGARSYVFEKRVHRKTRRVTIGAVDDWRLGDARERARELAVLVDKGRDPRDEAAAERAQAESRRVEAQRGALVFEGVWAAYIEASKAEWGERHLANHQALAHPGGERKKKRGGKGLTMAGPLASFLPLKLSEVTSERVASWLAREKRTRPTSTAQAFRALRAFVNWTHEAPEYKGIIPAEACAARAVRKLVPASKTKEGDCLQREQLPAWFREVRRISNPVIAAFLQGLLLLGPRREELAELRWSDVEFRWGGSITLRDKIEGERTIPLPAYTAALLSRLPRRNEWVFSSEEAECGHLVEPTKAHRLALKAAGIEPISLHGLRRSFGTLSEWVEVPVGIVAQIQGHKPSAVAEKHYRRRPLDLLRMWADKIEAWTLEQAQVPFVRPGEKPQLGVVGANGSVQPAA
ncbi:MAG TPA: integrase family protein [Steroidobacteraceae bacterium]|jgi:integrase|nr:integrase family protein [Steroidobacteraceae bacterium]